jgi:site-specific recombinase XerD
MAQRLVDLLEQFCQYQRKQRGKAEGGVSTYRWMLERFLRFVRAREGRLARVEDLSMAMLQAWLDEMAGSDLSINTLRCRLAAVSSWCNWLVKRNVLMVNPVNKMDRPPRQWTPPAVPSASIMDALIAAAQERKRPRDVALFLLLRFTGMRRESVATLRVGQLDGEWGLRNVRVKGGKVRDVPVPGSVMRFLGEYVQTVLASRQEPVTADTPLFWSSWGKRGIGRTRAPITGKNIWRLCKVYGAKIGYPTLKPHDLRHGVAMEVLGEHGNLEEVRALLGHARIDTTQVYTSIRPAQLKTAVAFYDERALRVLGGAENKKGFEEQTGVLETRVA